MFKQIFLFLLVLGLSQGQEILKYTYLCLDSTESKYCLGISPNGRTPRWNPTDIYQLQVKPRVRNEKKELDFKKTRWDIDVNQGTVRMSNFSSLYIGRKGLDNHAFLLPDCCNDIYFNLTEVILNKRGAIRLENTSLCLTVVKCNKGSNDWCDRESRQPVQLAEEVRGGNYVRFVECSEQLEVAQYFREDLTCVVNNCSTLAPTFSPSLTPSLTPTFSPTFSPTLSPTFSPSLTPSFSPTKYPTQEPTQEPTKQPTQVLPLDVLDGFNLSLFLLLFFIILVLCCLLVLIGFLHRNDKQERKEKEQDKLESYLKQIEEEQEQEQEEKEQEQEHYTRDIELLSFKK